jgi:CRISPR-associated endoribonuclease Cas6
LRFSLAFSSPENEFPIDYPRCFIHFIKKAIGNYDSDVYHRLYQGNTVKGLTFSVHFPGAKYTKDKVIFREGSLIIMTISVAARELGGSLCGALIQQMHHSCKTSETEIVLESVRLLPEERVTEPKILVNFQSPLVLQTRDGERDWFHGCFQDSFASTFTNVVSAQLKKLGYNGEGADIPVEITPARPKKLVVKNYEKMMECSAGTFWLKGHPAVLNYLYDVGVGSKRSSGYGMFSILRQGVSQE